MAHEGDTQELFVSEDSWAQRREWAEEKNRDIEIKFVSDIQEVGTMCNFSKCMRFDAVKHYVIGRSSHRGGLEVDLCAEHASEENAYEEYYEFLNDLAGPTS